MRTTARRARREAEVRPADEVPTSRRVWFHDPRAPRATAVVPSAFVAVAAADRLLLVRRCDSGMWELPGGRVDVGENAVEAAVRETAEESGVRIRVTGLVGLFTDPRHVIRGADGLVRQQFAVVMRGHPLDGTPCGDRHETCDAAWVAVADIPGLPMEPPVRIWIGHFLLADGGGPRLG
jgi:8-oxo-dGTP pyrophosphatase MutT (NUDIX family)